MAITVTLHPSPAQGLIMRTFFIALVVAAATLSGSSSFAADERNVTVVNGTGYGICKSCRRGALGGGGQTMGVARA